MMLYGEGLILTVVFTLGIPLLFVIFPLYSLVLFFVGQVPKNKILQIIVGGQTLEWLTALAFYTSSQVATLSGLRIPYDFWLKNIVTIFFWGNYLIQVLLMHLENNKTDQINENIPNVQN